MRQLARAEVKLATGRKAAPTALEVLANIDAMELAMTEAASSTASRRAKYWPSTAGSWGGNSMRTASQAGSGRARIGSAGPVPAMRSMYRPRLI